jgi:hypothetical protein
MARFLLGALMLASASAFAPASVQSKSSALTAIAPQKEIGVLPPIGFFEYVLFVSCTFEQRRVPHTSSTFYLACLVLLGLSKRDPTARKISTTTEVLR